MNNDYIQLWLAFSAVVSIFALVGWFAVFMTATDLYYRGSDSRRRDMIIAKRLIIISMLSWLWPLVIPSIFLFAAVKTFREAK